MNPVVQELKSKSSTENLSSKKGFVYEVFSGIQGEGPLVGFRQLFVRMNGCDLRCRWCDTPNSLSIKKDSLSLIEANVASRDFETYENPLSVEVLAEHIVNSYFQLPHHSVSLTGGEPLLQVDYLNELIKSVKTKKPDVRFYLETGGHRYRELIKLINQLDFISMDFKLSSSTGEPPQWENHREFLKIASYKEGYVKIVFTSDTLIADLEKALQLLTEVRKFPLVLQPMTPVSVSFEKLKPTPDQVLKFQDLAIRALGADRVRVIPQTHKFISQL
jgi:organic radical activating enzyme